MSYSRIAPNKAVVCRTVAAAFLVAAVISVGACTTPRSSSPAAGIPIMKGNLSNQGAASKEVEEARRLVEAEDYGTAIPRLLHAIAKYPGSEASADAHYWLGVAYYRIQSYRDAITMFQQYQELSPRGKYAADSASFAAKLTDEYDKRYMSPEQINAKINEVAAQAQADPGNVDLKLQLADLFWKRGDYAKAGQIYAQLVKAQPNLTAQKDIAVRVEFLPGGQYVVLTPMEIERRQIAENPIAVLNPAHFTSGADLFTREDRYYVVTGRVQNRGQSVLYGVQVQVTLYGFGNVVYDTNTVNIGRMNPGEIRAFSTQFSNFRNIDDINRYEIVPNFQR